MKIRVAEASVASAQAAGFPLDQHGRAAIANACAPDSDTQSGSPNRERIHLPNGPGPLPESLDSLIVVTKRISNRGRGRSQAEPDAYVYLRDAEGREIQASRTASPPPTPLIGDKVPAGQSLVVQARFQVSGSVKSPVLVKARRARFPGTFGIGDAQSLMHRPTVHALAPQ